MKVPVTRPRAHLIDFEVAASFEPDSPASEKMCIGLPLGGTCSTPSVYGRPTLPEMRDRKPWGPFKSDVVQLGLSLQDFIVRS